MQAAAEQLREKQRAAEADQQRADLQSRRDLADEAARLHQLDDQLQVQSLPPAPPAPPPPCELVTTLLPPHRRTA